MVLPLSSLDGSGGGLGGELGLEGELVLGALLLLDPEPLPLDPEAKAAAMAGLVTVTEGRPKTLSFALMLASDTCPATTLDRSISRIPLSVATMRTESPPSTDKTMWFSGTQQPPDTQMGAVDAQVMALRTAIV